MIETLRPAVAGGLACLLAVGSIQADDPRGTAYHTFHAPPAWDGFRNRLVPDSVPLTRQDFGWSRSWGAGGDAVGEIGGRVQRSTTRASYAKRLAPRTLQDALHASGTLAVTRAEGSSGVMLGWFHAESHGWRTPNSIALRLDGNGGKYWAFYEYGTRSVRTGGRGAFDGARYQTTRTPPFSADGTAHRWSLNYDPGRRDENGTITLTIDRKTYPPLAVPPEHKQDTATFNRFGIWNVQIGGKQMEVYVDDLTVDGQQHGFSTDPGWEAVGNRVEFAERVIRPLHDFGHSLTGFCGGDPGEIGGVVFRDEQPAYFAARVGRRTLEDALVASGRIALRSAASDSGVYLGWFDAETKRNNGRPEHEARQRNYLGILIEGPSRVGHYFRAGYGAADGRGENPTHDPRTNEPRPVILPDGTPHRWAISYAPDKDGGGGRITVRLDERQDVLIVPAEHRQAGAAWDRFGLFNMQSGGHHVEIFVDDLRFTTGTRH